MAKSNPEKEVSNKPEDIFVLGESFYRSSYVINRDASSLKGAPEQIRMNYIVNLTSVSIVNITFATELFLKCLSVIENGFFYRIHDLEQLFGFLSQDVQDKIIAHYDTIVNKIENKDKLSEVFGKEFYDFKSMLKQSSNAFIEFRYKFGNAKFIAYNLNDASQAIRHQIITTQPWWSLLKHND